MPLRTVVKVGNITNLSDARYCAGMGVEMLGFSVIPDTPAFIPPKVFQEIRGWLSGPKVVAQLYGMNGQTDLQAIVADYAPDYFELTASEFLSNVQQITLPCIVSAGPLDVPMLDRYDKILYVIVDEADLTALPAGTHPRLFRPRTMEKIWETITAHNLAGVALLGSQEIRPGFTDYNGLADILESLEE